LPTGIAPRRHTADLAKSPVLVVQPDQEGADARAGLVDAVAERDHVGCAGVLDLEERALAGCVGLIERFRHDAVESGSLELGQPAHRGFAIAARCSCAA